MAGERRAQIREWAQSYYETPSAFAELARRELAALELEAQPVALPFAEYRDDPVEFSIDVLGITPWPRQAEILRAVRDHDRVAVRSGHKTGKSCSVGITALHWVSTRPHGRVILTSSSYRQVRSVLWREISTQHAHAKRGLGGDLALDPEHGLRFPDGREVIGLATTDPNKFAGFSGPELIFIVDEANGIAPEIDEVLEGSRAGGAKVVRLGNPTKTSGEFYEAFTTKKQFYFCLHVSSEETPNVVERRNVVPGLATEEWVREKRAEWGEDSPIYQVRVRGNFPAQAENAVIGLADVEAARARFDEGLASTDEHIDIGVDVARFGDDETVFTAVRGKAFLGSLALQSMDGVQVAGKLLEFARTIARVAGVGTRPRVKVDEIGVGASVVDALREHADPDTGVITLLPVNVATSATAGDYVLLRDQLWFAIRDWLRDGGALPDDPKLEGELVAPSYSFDARGRQKVESKDEIKRRLKRSPDRADALGLAVYKAPFSESVGFDAARISESEGFSDLLGVRGSFQRY